VGASSGAELESSSEPSTNSSANRLSSASAGWKQEANHRLAAHRARRGSRSGLQTAFPGMEDAVEPAKAMVHPKTRNVADRVAARYAHAPTYSEILASEARNAARAAQAAADAAGEARDAAQAILVGLDVDLHDDWREVEMSSREAGRTPAHDTRTAAVAQHRNSSESTGREPARPHRPQPGIHEVVDDDEERFEEEPPSPIHPIPAKLLEFPRELVATRKARPRLAEGPLRDEYDRDASQSQLRIFEVESQSISTEPAVEQVLSGWSSIRLDPRENACADSLSSNSRRTSQDLPAESHRAGSGIDLPLQTASLEDRLMAGIVDAALTTAGFLVFVLVFAACTPHPPTGKPAAIGAAVALFAFALIYQILFFSFGQDTPGMRYSKVALCTFDDENPPRKAMRRRIGALLLSASPLGLGILWAFFDDDRLGWHDRISRTYQRSYR
jgi:uncharacterized RDD family membrane protein YckC